ncbi:MAG: serine protease [Phenylobacterium sp.]|jgi:serine protease
MFKHTLIALAIGTVTATSMTAFAQSNLDSSHYTNPKPVVIADTVKQAMTLAPLTSAVAGVQSSNEITIKQAGAVFIKVHFSHFNLPAGAYVTVSDLTGKESYRYDGQDHKSATFSASAGENGLNQFAAMSVFGDTAIVKLIVPPGVVWQKQHAIKVDKFNAGSSEDSLADKAAQAQAISPVLDVVGSEPFSSCGVNERRDVACWSSSHPVEYARTSPVARLLMAGSGLCTGWRASDTNRMFTNNHCLDNQDRLENTEIWFNYQADTCNGTVDNSKVVKVTGKDLLKTNYQLDYTLFTVNDFAQVTSFGHFGLDPRAPELGEIIYIPQHGAGNPKELAIESDQNVGGLCRIDVASAYGRAADTDTGYFCDTTGGSSGSPVLAGSSNKVIALHHFGGCENKGVKIERIWPEVAEFFRPTPPGGQAPVARGTVSCTNLSCEFDGSDSSDSDGTIVDYSWSINNNVINGVKVQHTFASAGTYNVYLKVADDSGLTNTQAQTVTVTEAVSEFPQADIAGSQGE